MTDHHAGRPPHPTYGPPLSGAPLILAGVTYRPYRIGVGRTARVSDDFRIELRQSSTYRTWFAFVDGQALPTKFRFKDTAARAAVRAAAKEPAQ